MISSVDQFVKHCAEASSLGALKTVGINTAILTQWVAYKYINTAQWNMTTPFFSLHRAAIYVALFAHISLIYLSLFRHLKKPMHL